MPTGTRDITLLYRADKSDSASFTLYPLVVSPEVKDFAVTTDLDWVLRHDRNRCLWIVGWFRGKTDFDNEAKLLDKLRAKYDVLAYFDLKDGSEIMFSKYLPWFDLWYKKQLLRNRSEYLRPFNGNRFFTEFYVDKYGIKDEPEPEPLVPVATADLGKLRTGWNILLGSYPLRPLVRRASAVLANTLGLSSARLLVHGYRWKRRPRPNQSLCHARFSWGEYRPTVGFQRKLFFEAIKNKPGFLAGRVPAAQYARELRVVRGILSPFGWGEVCYRDSEAVRSGAVLFKPDTGHLETWPDLYQAGKTYIPLAWDASDVETRVAEVLGDEDQRTAVTEAAWKVLAEAEEGLAGRVSEIAHEIRTYQR